MTVQYRVEFGDLNDQLRRFYGEVSVRHMKDAVGKGGEVIANAYRNILHLHETEPGNKKFINAYQAVTVKTGRYSDGTGAWFVVGGTVLDGKMLAPQQQFGERGTVVRETKDHANRGQMAAYNWLEKAGRSAVEDAKQVIIQRLSKIVH